jgi:hypothetical protein
MAIYADEGALAAMLEKVWRADALDDMLRPGHRREEIRQRLTAVIAVGDVLWLATKTLRF